MSDIARGPQQQLSRDSENALQRLIDAKQANVRRAQIESSPQRSANPNTSKFVKYREELPIYNTRTKFLELVNNHPVVIVEGETGCGKSTQLSQYLMEAGYTMNGKIGCTQPRRIAAKSLAKRVAGEVGTELGDAIGYRVRFENKTTRNTKIIYMTDGILLHQLLVDPNIYSYSVIVLDEVQERTIDTDILMGLLKAVIQRRPNLKVVVTSATMDCTKFSTYFNGAPIFKIPGRTFPVVNIFCRAPNVGYIKAGVQKVLEIHRQEPEGDILVFLGGRDEIEDMRELLESEVDSKGLWVLPCYSELSTEEQNLVFELTPPEHRKVVIATNIAEASITIEGIVYVVDAGFVKQNVYNPKKRLTTLKSVRISKAQAIQRSGRAGRTRPGKVYRLYDEEEYENMPETSIPEIRHSNLEQRILLLLSHGVQDLYNFDFLDKPSPKIIESALTELTCLGALKEGKLTEIGREISKFPLEPKLAKVLISSVQLDCLDEVLAIVSMLSVQQRSIFLRPKNNQQAAEAKAKLSRPEGDFLTLLEAFQQWCSFHYSEAWCKENFVKVRVLQEALEIRTRLEQILEDKGFPSPRGYFSVNPEAVQKAFAREFYRQIAWKANGGPGYVTFANPKQTERFFIHPGSSLKTQPKWIICERLHQTGKYYLVNVIAVEPAWIREFVPDFYEELVKKLIRESFPPS